MNISQLLTKLKTLVYSKSETDSLLGGKASSSHTHTKSQITDFPTIPSKVSQLTNDSGFITGVSWDSVSGKPSTFTPSSHTHTKSQITDFPSYGNTAGTICQGNDSRLSDARTPYFANGTWYAVGDDAAIGDHNVGGGLGVKALNSTTTRIDLCYRDDAANYKSITYDGTTLYMNGNCDYATSAGSVAWGNVSGRPTAVSQFSNDSGFITSSGSCNYANSAGNSDTLDGYHEYSFLRNRGGTSTSGEDTLWAQIGIKQYNGALPDGLSGLYNWGEVVSLAGTNSRFDIYCSHNSSNGNGLYYRSGWGDDKKDWRCFIDSANIGSQSVNYATNSGYTNWLRTSSHADHLFHTEWDGSYFWTYVTASDGGYRAVRVERSNSSGYADSCTETAYMGQYSSITYGVNRLQYFNSPTSTTSGAANVANPWNDWFYHLLMSHGNNNGYYGDIAMCFHSDTLAFRRIVSGSDQGWCYLVKNGRTIVSGYEVYVG